MSRLGRWAVTAITSAVVFVLCLWLARAVNFEWMPHAEADRWVVATAFAAVISGAAGGGEWWWTGRDKNEAAASQRRVSQRLRASGRAKANQVGGNQNAPAAGPPDRVKQRAKVSGKAKANQVAGNQEIPKRGRSGRQRGF
jgi:hypothetical protein